MAITINGNGTITGISAGGLPSAATDLSNDTSPQLGGSLDMNNLNITCNDSSSGGNNRIVMGSGADFQFWHDGSNSFIADEGTGALKVLSNLFRVNNAANDEAMIKAEENAGVTLSYNGSTKFETNSQGISITGKLHTQLGTETNSYNREATGDLLIFQTTGTTRGSISSNGSTVAYNTSSSDRTLKKNFQDWTDSVLPNFKALKPQTFNFTFEKDDDAKHKGYIAQDNVAAFPEAYPKNNDDKYVFNPSGMTIYLMKALQEAVGKIETLETKVAALEAA